MYERINEVYNKTIITQKYPAQITAVIIHIIRLYTSYRKTPYVHVGGNGHFAGFEQTRHCRGKPLFTKIDSFLLTNNGLSLQYTVSSVPSDAQWARMKPKRAKTVYILNCRFGQLRCTHDCGDSFFTMLLFSL